MSDIPLIRPFQVEPAIEITYFRRRWLTNLLRRILGD